MKSKIFSIIIVLSAFVFYSCEKWLDEPHRNQLTIEGFYESPQQMEQALIGAYDRVQVMYNQYHDDILHRAEDMWHISLGGPAPGIDKFQKQTIGNVYQHGYEAIKGINVILESIDGVDFADENDKNQIMGEAYFLRALTYFEMARFYGDLPIVTTVIDRAEALTRSRDPISEVYAQVHADLDAAMPLLPEDDISSKPSKHVVRALKADVYMTEGNMSSAIPLLQDIVNSGDFSLLSNYADIFDWQNPEHDEAVFQVQYKGEDSGEGNDWTFKHHRQLAANYPEIFEIESHGGAVPTLDSWLTLDHNSQRAQATVDTLHVGNVAYPYNKKIMGWQRGFNWQGEDNLQVYRYGEILLMLAEAEIADGNQANGIEALNMVRRRAYGLDPNTAAPGIDYAGDGSAIDTLYQEQYRELMYEGKRFYDLVRQGRFVEELNEAFHTDWDAVWDDVLPGGQTQPRFEVYDVSYLNIQVEEFMKVFPFPQGEINKNPSLIRDNPGWDQL